MSRRRSQRSIEEQIEFIMKKNNCTREEAIKLQQNYRASLLSLYSRTLQRKLECGGYDSG